MDEIMNVGKIYSMQYMRAVAIVSIVLWHVVEGIGLPWESGYHKVVTLFFSDGTSIFVMISGFFFKLSSYKYEVRSYLKSKLKNVISPYIIIMVVSIIIFDPSLSYTKSHVVDGFVRPINYPLWFIPFITTVFLLTPALAMLSSECLSIAAALCVFIVIVTDRGDFSLTNHEFFIGNIIHYIPLFIVGMCYAENFQKINEFVRRNIKMTFACFLLATIIILMSNFQCFQYLKRDFYSFYKIPLTLLLVVFFECVKIKGKASAFLTYIGDISFPIFFLHAIFLIVLFGDNPLGKYVSSLPDGYKLLSSLIITMANIFLCAAISSACKFLFKDKSRLIIGY